MKLKELHLLGFKSFPDKTVIKFSEGITAILGPNGCGKTNILDALRWVLGEQNLSLIRCGKNEELIFAGTKNRPPLNFCEVKLILENDEPDSPYGSEIEIKRRYFRTGEMEYFLNRNPCRLKDIEELFFRTGSKAYSLFSLSDIRRIIHGEVRRFFDEAANLKKYQENKKEVFQKLDLTERDLQRIEDILRERKRIVLSLRRQKRRWEIYSALRQEENLLRLSEVITRKKIKEERLAVISKEVKEITHWEESHQNEIEKKSNEWRETKERIKAEEEKREVYQKEISNLKEELSSLSQELIKWESRLSFLKESQKRLVAEKERLVPVSQVELEKKREELRQLTLEEETLEKEMEGLREEVRVIEGEILQKEAEKEKRERIRAKIFDEIIKVSTELSEKRSKLLVWNEKISGLEDIVAGDNLLGKVAEFFVCPAEYEKAVVSALFPYHSFYLLKDWAIKPKAIEKEIGFIVNGGQKKSVPGASPPAVRGLAKDGRGEKETPPFPLTSLSDVCQIKDGCPELIVSLLQKTFICHDYESAKDLFSRFPNYSFVTKDGICLRPEGVIILTGSDKTTELGVTQIRTEIEEKEKEKANLENEKKEKEEEIQKLEKEISGLKERSREKLRRSSELLLSLGRIREKKKVFETECQFINEERTRAVLKEEDIIKEMEEVQREIEELTEYYNQGKKRLAEIKEKISTKEKEKGEIDLATLKTQQETIEEEIARRREEREKLAKEREEKVLEEFGLKKEIEELKRTIERMSQEIGREIREEEIVALGDVTERLQEINRKILSVGRVNPLAKEEYEKEKEELDKLLKERDDCHKAADDLKTIIKEIDQKVKEDFLNTFGKVRENFREIFARLFIEGEGDLVLEKPEDPIASDIIIIAKPQGKNPKRLEQLSDGEKALLSLSLLFAFYKVKPAPFSFMDEVDAPLDDANVERFVSFLREMSNNTQVVIITHNRLTLEKVDVLLGVTSEEPGISKLITMKLKGESHQKLA
ncbi:MAG: AAA family ATPase [candidate division WOR-3 bacterium]